MGPIILAFDAANHLGSSLGFLAGDDESSEPATFDTAGVETLGVPGQLQTEFRVVAVNDCRTFCFWEIGLVFVPHLETRSI